MKVAEPEAALLAYTQLPLATRTEDPCSDMARVVERCGRVSWKSEEKIGPGTADGFCVRVLSIKKDYSIAEHASATLLLVTDRYTSHQLVRHRLGAMTQESTHYISYAKEKFGGEITVMRPLGVPAGSEAYEEWLTACRTGETAYLRMIELGYKHHQARFALPGCLKTEIAMTYNLRMWRTILEQRCSPNNTRETVYICFLAARILAKLCPEIMGEWAQKAEDFLADKTING